MRRLLAALPLLLAACGQPSTPSSGPEDAGVQPGVTDGGPGPFANAPPPFQDQAQLVVPVDIVDETLAYSIDVAGSAARGHAELSFHLAQAGAPMLRMTPAVRAATLDGAPLDPAVFRTVTPAADATPVLVLGAPVAAGAHRLVLDFALAAPDVVFENGGATLVSVMDDLRGSYLDRYAPANFEFDQFPLHLAIDVTGATHDHQLFANGEVTHPSASSWRVEFSPKYTSSSTYFHFTAAELEVARDTYQGQAAAIPLVAFKRKAETADLAAVVTQLKTFLATDEGILGPFPHPAYLVYLRTVTNSEVAMEFAGAAESDPTSVEHELLHSWVGRGIMPSSGNSGWIDEAIVTWGEYGWLSRAPDLAFAPAHLADASPYSTVTPDASYGTGMRLMAMLDRLAADQGGLRPILREWVVQRAGQTVTTVEFEELLKARLSTDPTRLLERYVHGKSN